LKTRHKNNIEIITNILKEVYHKDTTPIKLKFNPSNKWIELNANLRI